MLQVHSFKDTRLKIKITENAENHDSSLVFKAVAVAKKNEAKNLRKFQRFFLHLSLSFITRKNKSQIKSAFGFTHWIKNDYQFVSKLIQG